MSTELFGELVRLHGRSDVTAFVAAFDHPVLVQRRRPEAPRRTTPPPGAAGFSTRKIEEGALGRAMLGTLAPDADTEVIRLVKGDGGQFPGMVTVGRAPNMDVVLTHDSISKFHAFFSRDGDGWVLTDAGSTNGTAVNEQRLAANAPVALRVGSRVVFGHGQAWSFFPARDFHALLAEAAKAIP
jgi:hypothetical protein